MTTADAVLRGRDAFDRQAWAEAYASLNAADCERPLEAGDLTRLALTAQLAGKHEESVRAWERAHQEWLREGDIAGAARCAFWLGMSLFNAGEVVRAGGWLGRARRLLDESGLDCVERGYLLVPEGRRLIAQGDAEAARAAFDRAGEIGARFGDRDLVAMAQLGRGSSRIQLGETAEGLALLDEAMIAVVANELSPMVSGIVYCAVIDVCQEIFDLQRAQEWTGALSDWCASHPEMVPFQGQCLVHRAAILQRHGAWPDAMSEAQRARERLLLAPGQPAVGSAYYQQAELYRLRGDFAEAEDAYRQASRWGRSPEPGLALLRLAQGQTDAAAGSIRRAVDEAEHSVKRADLLAAHVRIMLAANEVAAARTSADELVRMVQSLGAPLLQATAAEADGAVLLAEGDARAALSALRRAWTGWQKLDAPYDAARVRVLVGLACRALGDEDSAEMELDAATWAFDRLGAGPDLARVRTLTRQATNAAPGGLTAREVEVLRLVAAGKTNRAIADDLFLSEKTVARHLSNIFAKLGLSSRAAATAYAYEHHLAGG